MRQIFNFQFSIFNYKKGFTLIELLVVIAVVGIVSAAVFAAINVAGNLNKANLANAKTFAASLENSLAINQVGKWSFEEEAGDIAKDTSGYGNDGTVSPTSVWRLASEPDCNDLGFGGCLNLASAYAPPNGGFVQIPDQDFFSPSVNDITVSVWAKVPIGALSNHAGGEGCGSAGNYMIAKGNPPPPDGWEWAIESDNNDVICFIMWQLGGGEHLRCRYPVKVDDNKWHHYAAVMRPNTKIIGYRDGVSICQNTVSALSMGNGNSPVWIGKRGDGNYFNGYIDEAAIYNSALAFNQVHQLYARGLPKHQLASK